MRAYYDGKGQVKPLELLLPRNIINRKQYLIPGTISEISATIKDLKDARVVIPIISPFDLPIRPVEKAD